MRLMNIYNCSPIFLQNVMTTLQGYIYKNERYGRTYHVALEEYRHRNYSDLTALKNYQKLCFTELLYYALNHSPFYKEYYSGIDIDKVVSLGKLSLLPVLEKETVRQNIERMYTIPINKGVISNTSGTTGKTMRFLYHKDDLQRRLAYLDSYKIRCGYIPMKMKRASFNSSKIIPSSQNYKTFWRDNLAIKQRIYSGFHCKGVNLKYYVENLDNYKPESIDGYPSAMYELSRYIIDNDIKLSFKPIAIFPTAETLLPHYRASIEEAFKCSVYDQYASSEGAPFIVTCSSGKLHYCMDTGIIEFLDDGKMLMTCFNTHGTPLIRYDIGDRAYLAEDQNCNCGCKMPVVERIEGRNSDYILSQKNGKFTAIYMSLVSGEFLSCIKAMQFVQDDLNSIDVNIATDKRYKPEMNKIIEDKLHYSLGDNMIIRIHIVDEIPKEESGKFRFIVNRLNL